MNNIGQDVIMTCSLGDKENCIVTDPGTGNVITAFKGGSAPTKCLATIGGDYVISVLDNKPLLNVWSWPNKNRIEYKVVLPGIPSALDVSASGHHCFMGINNKIYIWHVSTGNLLRVIDYHPTDVKCLKLSKCERYLVSVGTKETSVVVWDMFKVLDSNQMPRPLYTFHDHNSVINDIFVSSLGSTSKVVSCGKDCSCFVYDLSNGERIYAMFHSEEFTTVVMDPCQYSLYLGTVNGDIFVVRMDAEEKHVDPSDLPRTENIEKWNKEHDAAITCLSMSPNGEYLVSGSKDGTARLWNVCFAKCMKIIKHQGEVTNAFFSIIPYSLICPDMESPELLFSPLKKSINVSDSSDDILTAKLSSGVPRMVFQEPSNEVVSRVCFRDMCVEPKQKSSIERELAQTQTVTDQMYSFVMGTFLNNVKPELVPEASEN